MIEELSRRCFACNVFVVLYGHGVAALECIYTRQAETAVGIEPATFGLPVKILQDSLFFRSTDLHIEHYAVYSQQNLLKYEIIKHTCFYHATPAIYQDI